MKAIVEKWIPILRRKDRYRTFNTPVLDIKSYPLTLEADEMAFGVYENFANQVEGSIVVTNKGIHYCISDSQSKKLRYEDVQKAIFRGDILTVEVLEIQLKDGTYFSLPIRRSDENSRFTDIFEFLRFINRVRDDL